jgi:hypothetical protein
VALKSNPPTTDPPPRTSSWRLCSLPRRIAGRLPHPPRRIFYFLLSQRPVRRGGWAQRNCGALGMTAGGLGGSACLTRPPRRILFFFSQSLSAVDRALERGYAPPVRCGVREGDFCANRVQMKKCI